ncbi:MAG: DUF3011 domain-containing protein [Terriglobales bacterium]
MKSRWLLLALLAIAPALASPALAQQDYSEDYSDEQNESDGRVVRCESNDERYHFCRTGPIARAILRRQISGSACSEDRTWGFRADGIWVDKGCRGDFEVQTEAEARGRTLRCESNNGDYHLCPTGPISGAEMVRQISGSPCREGYTWGHRPDGIWVDKGCRAEFRVRERVGNRPAANIVRCESHGGSYRFCHTGPVGRIELNRQISGSPCREGHSWGRRADGIWVDKGCRAEFVVHPRRRLVPRTIRCNSDNEDYQFCPTGPIQRAEMTRQFSGSPCREAYSWGSQRDGVWVDRGCRAEFTVYGFEEAGGGQRDNARRIRCSSDFENYQFCSTGPINDAEVAVQISGTPCDKGRTWGVRPDGIWVDKGCRAEFTIW